MRRARFCTSPTSCSVLMRNSSSGLKQHEPEAAADSKRKTLLWACSWRQPAVSSYSSPLRSVYECAFGPRKQGWDHQADPFAAARGRVTQDMFWSVVPKVADLSAFIAPGADVDAIVVKQACGFDIAFIGPARRTVEKRVDAERAAQRENEK